MIELIFALVIMGITMMSAPLLISKASNTNTVAFQQESIAIISSHTNALLTYAWDEQNTVSQVDFENKILRVNDGNIALNETNRTTPGIRQFDVNPLATATTLIGDDANETISRFDNDDIDDFVANTLTINLIAGTSQDVNDGDYMDSNTTLTLTTQVNYMEEKNVAFTTNSIVYNIPKATQAITTNIKYIVTSLTSNRVGQEKNIKLKAFMCNIGAARAQSSLNMPNLQNANAVGLF